MGDHPLLIYSETHKKARFIGKEQLSFPKLISFDDFEELIGFDVGVKHAVLFTSSRVFGYGSNTEGQLGFQSASMFADLHPFIRIIACGGYSTFAVTSKGVYGYGCNDDGILGNGTFELSSSVAKMQLPEDDIPPNSIRKLCLCTYHAFVIGQRHIFACGLNTSGQLGIGHCSNVNMPVRHPFFTDASEIVDIRGGGKFSIFWSRKSGLWASGFDTYGNLGNNSKGQMFEKPTQITFFQDPADIAFIRSADGHTMVLTHSDGLYVFGYGFWGQLGDFGLRDKVVPQRASFFADPNNFAFVDTTAVARPVLAEETWAEGFTTSSRRNNPELAVQIFDVYTTTYYTYFMTSAGLYASGRNQCGRLYGLETTDRVTVPQQVVSLFSLSISEMAEHLRFPGWNRNLERKRQIAILLPLFLAQRFDPASPFHSTVLPKDVFCEILAFVFPIRFY